MKAYVTSEDDLVGLKVAHKARRCLSTLQVSLLKNTINLLEYAVNNDIIARSERPFNGPLKNAAYGSNALAITKVNRIRVLKDLY